MLTAILLPALLAAAASSGTPPAVTAISDPCDGVAALEDGASCGNAPLCSRRQRVRLACDLRDALERRYIFYSVKGAMIAGAGGEPFDARRHLDACVAEERAVANEDDPLRFYDRLRRCTAAFEDGHLLLSAPVRLPQVALGIGLARVDGRLYVANRERTLVRHLAPLSGIPDLEAVLAVGNEVVEIDGRPAAEVLAEVARYVPASSTAARLEKAVDALTRRDFLFPSRRTASLTIVAGGARRVVELPWSISPDGPGHVMTQAYVRRTGIATTDLVAWRHDQPRDGWDREGAPAQGYLRTEPILPARDAAALRAYADDRGRTAVRLGEVVRRRDRAFCYLQILSFQTEDLASGDTREPFATVLDGFVRECKDKELDLVLDLRSNGGGFLAHSSALVSMIGDARRTYPGGALLLRATTTNQLVYQQRAPAVGGGPAREVDDDLEPRTVAEVIGAARRVGAAFTRALVEKPIQASDAVGGYRGRVLALVSPSCMSACDRLAAMLRVSGRALLIGGPTEGAGGSQQETRSLPVRWTDAGGVVTLAIPNAAMGVLPASRRGEAPPSADDFFRALAFENRPVLPDVPYATTLEDVREHDRGWLEQVDRALFGPGDAAREVPAALSIRSPFVPSVGARTRAP